MPTINPGPDPRDVVRCGHCQRKVLWLPGAYGQWMLVEAKPTIDDFRPPFAGELKYVHGEHQPHFCLERQR